MLVDAMDVIVPDLRGFGESDKHAVAPRDGYSAAAQARSVVGVMDELELDRVLVAGYDIGSRVAQTIAQSAPERVRALVLAPPLPGAGDRVLTPAAQQEFWYQAFHQLELIEHLLDGKPDAIRAYLRHFWSRWSGPAFELGGADLDQLVEHYAKPGAFVRRSAGIAPDPARSPGALPNARRPPSSASLNRRACFGLSMTRSFLLSGAIGSTHTSPASP
jgi:pimeloyl-ACP methyl ester carboxylesterase